MEEECFLKGSIIDNGNDEINIQTICQNCDKAEQATIIMTLIADFAEGDEDILEAFLKTARSYFYFQRAKEEIRRITKNDNL